MNRGMMLMDNTLELLVVVIFVALVVGGGGIAVYKYFENNEEKNAQRFLDALVDKSESIEVGKGNSFLFQGFKGGNYWYLVGWDVNDPKRPEKCFFNNCICVCNAGPDAKNCQENSFCREVLIPHSFNTPTVSCTTLDTFAVAYKNVPQSLEVRTVSNGILSVKIDPVYDYSYKNNVLLYRRNLRSSQFIQLSHNAFAFDITRTDNLVKMGSNSDLFLGSVDLEGVSVTESNRIQSIAGADNCRNADPYKAVFYIPNNRRDELILDSEVYKKEYKLNEVEFKFVNDR